MRHLPLACTFAVHSLTRIQNTILMKRVLLLLLFFTAFSGYAPPQAQVTITADFPRFASFTDSVFRTPPGSEIPRPTFGENQFWDYSNLVDILADTVLVEYRDASGDSNFPNARNSREFDLIFQGFLIDSDQYEAVDEQGWYGMGRVVRDTSYSITPITGGPNDTLRFVGGTLPFEGRLDFIKFPLNYGDEWTETTIEPVDFSLSVAAFGLNQVPGRRELSNTEERRVVGSGQLVIPTASGSPSAPIDVLLFAVVSTTIDSVFLGGAPAPAPLMAAFGLVQGGMTRDSFYIFYNPDYGGKILDFGEGPGRAFYHPAVAETISSLYQPNLAVTKAFPNPILAGQSLRIELENPMRGGLLRLVDMQGRVLAQQAFDALGEQSPQLRLPLNIPPGMYIYQLFDHTQQLYGAGKVQLATH